MPHIVDWPGRLKEMADFVGLGDEDLAVIKETSSVVLDNADDLTAAVYDNFLKFPESRKFFLNENGEVDDVRLDRRKHSLARWLRGSCDFKIDEDYPIRVLATGIVHSHPPVHRAHLGSIPSRFMIGTMSFTQTALADLLVSGQSLGAIQSEFAQMYRQRLRWRRPACRAASWVLEKPRVMGALWPLLSREDHAEAVIGPWYALTGKA